MSILRAIKALKKERELPAAIIQSTDATPSPSLYSNTADLIKYLPLTIRITINITITTINNKNKNASNSHIHPSQ
jgi:hypothetical protein